MQLLKQTQKQLQRRGTIRKKYICVQHCIAAKQPWCMYSTRGGRCYRVDCPPGELSGGTIYSRENCPPGQFSRKQIVPLDNFLIHLSQCSLSPLSRMSYPYLRNVCITDGTTELTRFLRYIDK